MHKPNTQSLVRIYTGTRSPFTCTVTKTHDAPDVTRASRHSPTEPGSGLRPDDRGGNVRCGSGAAAITWCHRVSMSGREMARRTEDMIRLGSHWMDRALRPWPSPALDTLDAKCVFVPGQVRPWTHWMQSVCLSQDKSGPGHTGCKVCVCPRTSPAKVHLELHIWTEDTCANQCVCVCVCVSVCVGGFLCNSVVSEPGVRNLGQECNV